MKPILFSTPMVKAILEGRKTQTRRVVRYKDKASGEDFYICNIRVSPDRKGAYEVACEDTSGVSPSGLSYGWIKPPYQPGDILWVRETWNKMMCLKDGCKTNCTLGNNCTGYVYAAIHFGPEVKPWKPSIFMPREAARLFLEVKSARVERLQKISPEDCVAEGAVKNPHYMKYGGEKCLVIHKRYKDDFMALWDSINAKREGGAYAWENNPWVWVYEFKRKV